jgi:hypothetical protein
VSILTTCEPIRPVPPITVNFMSSAFRARRRARLGRGRCAS